MVTVYLGVRHDSSAVHETVIEHLTDESEAERLIGPIRATAGGAARCLVTGDLGGYGAALSACTEAQAALHPSLVSPLARLVIDIGARSGAVGWKVNGAGGAGGTVTMLAPTTLGPCSEHWRRGRS